MKGKIYKIEGYGLTYYGSTIQNLNDRKYTHVSAYKNRHLRPDRLCMSWVILDKGDDWIIELIEEIEFEDLDELRLRESYYQKNNDCVNKTKLKTKDELREYNKGWAENNIREKGAQIKTEMVKTKDPNYKTDWARAKREKLKATETEEEKEARLEQRRLNRKPLTEEQKEKARERARQQRAKKSII